MFTLRYRVAALAACCMLSLAAFAARAESDDQYRAQFGVSADGASYDREIVVAAKTRWINIVSGQVIRFVIVDPGRPTDSFTWRFDTFGSKVADLSRLAPAGMVQRPIKVYIADDPHNGGA